MSQEQGCCGKAGEKMTEFDLYGKSFNFKLPQGKEKFSTKFGLCFTFTIAIMCAYYAMLRMTKLVTRDDADIRMAI